MKTSVPSKSLGGIFLPQNSKLQNQTTSRKHAVILLGPPAGGKSGVAKDFLEQGLVHYSSSAALNEYAEKHGFFQVKEQMKQGELVEFEHVHTVSGWHYRDFLSNNQRTRAVFDGWWRVADEIREIQKPLKVCDVNVCILNLFTSRECAESRSRGRDRFDDTAFHHRFNIYEQNIRHVLGLAEKFFGKDRIHILDTTHMSEEQVRQQARRCIGLGN